MKERKTEITVETCEVLVISRQGILNRSWCPSCAQHVPTVSLTDARLSGLSVEAVQRQLETGLIHLIEAFGGSSLICLNSLTQT